LEYISLKGTIKTPEFIVIIENMQRNCLQTALDISAHQLYQEYGHGSKNIGGLKFVPKYSAINGR